MNYWRWFYFLDSKTKFPNLPTREILIVIDIWHLFWKLARNRYQKPCFNPRGCYDETSNSYDDISSSLFDKGWVSNKFFFASSLVKHRVFNLYNIGLKIVSLSNEYVTRAWTEKYICSIKTKIYLRLYRR